MKFLIDSEEISLPETSGQSFQQCCQNIMGVLLEKQRSIGSLKIDGKDAESTWLWRYVCFGSII